MNTEELKRLAQAATPGPWAYTKDSNDFPVNGYVTVRDCIYSVCILPYEGIRTDYRVTDNGLFIAAANPAAILALIQQRDELLAEMRAIEDILNRETNTQDMGYELFRRTNFISRAIETTERKS